MCPAFEPTGDPGWVIAAPGHDPEREADIESRLAIGNGLLAVRGTRDIARATAWNTLVSTIRPASWPRAYVAGLFDTPDIQPPVPVLVPVPDWLRVRVRVDGVALVLGTGEVLASRRVLDLRRGVLMVEWVQRTAAGVIVRVRSLRAASRATPRIGLQLVEVEAGRDGVAMALEARFDAAGVGLDLARIAPDLGIWRTEHGARQLAMAGAACLHVGGTEVAAGRREPLGWAWEWRAQANQPALFSRLVAAVRDDGPPEPATGDELATAARAALGEARAQGWRGVLAAHEAAWARRWHESGVSVGGDAAAQAALRFAVYHLVSAANPDDDLVSVGARALTGDSYLGHVFWDTEIYLLPFYTLTWPAAARALLMYRHHTLPAARAKAASMGWRGALYAWESADTGEETTPDHIVGDDGEPVAVLCGIQEQHISADIAHAVWHYWNATHDHDFLRGPGAEILMETARFWASRAVPEADGRRHIRGVIGPDEFHEGIDDNAFTNVMARWNLRRAADVADLLRERWPDDWVGLAARLGLDEAEPEHWRAAADEIAVLHDPETGLFEQFEGFFGLDDVDLGGSRESALAEDARLGPEGRSRSQVLKQADVVALLVLLPEEADHAAKLANFRYYAPRCVHLSSLSEAMHALLAARLGLADLALRHFRVADSKDLDGVVGDSAGGVHIAALGGMWQVAVMGFGGLSWQGETLRIDPHLPPHWASLDYAVQWRGRHLRVRVARRGGVHVGLEAGDALDIEVCGTGFTVARGHPVEIVPPQ